MSYTTNRRDVVAGAAGLGGAALLLSLAGCSATDGPGDATGASLRDFRSIPPEGGRVIFDRAQYPQTYQEAPQLAELVRQGRLPPVRERIGHDPIVVEPLHEIGRYGGVLRRAFVGPGDGQTATRFAAGPDSLLFWTADWKTLRPNIARDFEISRDGRITTIFLRRGMRWSDGAPFTADDILFWYEDMYGDPRIVSSRAPALRIGGKDVLIRKVDDFTVEYVSPEPYFLLVEMLAGFTDIGGPSAGNRAGLGGYAPRHYLSRFHAKYVEEAQLSRQAREAGFVNWAIYLKNRYDWSLNPDTPVVSPWRVTSPINTQRFSLTRNAYSVWVDTAGNQLPYVDDIVHTFCSGGEAINFKAAAGDFDFQDRHLQVGKLPFLLHNRERSNYNVHLNPFEGADLSVRINLNYREDPEIGALLADKRFRRALSLATDRSQINETFLFGTGLPTAAVPSPQNKYYPGDEWAHRWAVHDPVHANRLLDDIGLTARDRQGYRMRRDGEGRVRLVSSAGNDQFDYPSVSEMLRDQWRSIGVDVDTKIEPPNLWLQRAMAGTLQITPQYTITEDPLTYPDFLFPYSRSVSGAVIGVDYARWFQTNGAEGLRPPEEIRELMQLWKQSRVAPLAQRIELGKEIIRRHVDDVLTIGLVSSGLAIYGVFIANKDLGNVPRRVVNTSCVRTPATALPMTFFYRNRD